MSQESERPVANDRNTFLTMLSSVGWPVLFGLAATSVFFVLIYRGPLNLPIMHRYFASHPVTFCETGLFLIGLAALIIKGRQVLSEYRAIRAVTLAEPPPSGQPVAASTTLIDDLDGLASTARNCLLGRRLRDALQHVERANSADELNDELKYLADIEAARQQDSYALVRIVIWATPMLGFLGTVMGITQALGDLSANAELLATAIDTAIQGLLGGLYVAFDTTALALTLSMILMFIQFLIERVEIQVLNVVDRRANEELVGRFETAGLHTDPQLAAVQRMIEAVVQSTDQLVQRQAQLWHGTIESAHERWNTLFHSLGDQVETKLGNALEQSLKTHVEQLAQAEQSVSAKICQSWEGVQAGLTENAMLMLAQQTELVKHGEVMVKVLQATGDVVKLEQVLNQNLAALAGSSNFEDTVMSLSAAIHLLNTRLGKPMDGVSGVDLTRPKLQGRAA